MLPGDLKVGDRIRIIGIPGEGVPGYFIHADTKYVFRKLVARGTPVRIYEIDAYGTPWYQCRFRIKNGKMETHWLAVCPGETNWKMVKRRNRPVADGKSYCKPARQR
jgi:hypothetical protein